MPSKTFAVSPGSPKIVVGSFAYNGDIIPPVSITAKPGASGSLLVEFRVSAAMDWEVWSVGNVTEVTTQGLTLPLQALRFTATSAAGSVGVSVVMGDVVESV